MAAGPGRPCAARQGWSTSGESLPPASRIGPRPIHSSVVVGLGLRFSPKGLPVARRVVKAFQPDDLSAISYICQSVLKRGDHLSQAVSPQTYFVNLHSVLMCNDMNIAKKKRPRKFSDEKKRVRDHYQQRGERKINEREKQHHGGKGDFMMYSPFLFSELILFS